MRRWFETHKTYPYPDENEKAQLAQESGISVERISNWMINARVRRLSEAEKDVLRKRHDQFKMKRLSSAKVMEMIRRDV